MKNPSFHRHPIARSLRVLGLALTLGLPAMADPQLTTLPYKEVDGEPLLLDIRRPDPEAPASTDAGWPVVLVVHGGGWGSGDRKTLIPSVLEALAEAGFLCVSIDYRLSPQHRWPACREDVDDALAWTKANVSKHGGDPDRMAILGYSAGGQLAFWAAIRDEDPPKLKALVGLAPATDLLEDLGRRGGPSKAMRDLMDYREEEPFEQILLKMYQASPINHLHDQLPPILLIHGNDDRSVPFQQSLHIQHKIEDNQWEVPCEIYEIDGAPHRQSEWDRHDRQDDGYKRKLVEWLGKQLATDD